MIVFVNTGIGLLTIYMRLTLLLLFLFDIAVGIDVSKFELLLEF